MSGLNISGTGTLLISHVRLGREVLVTLVGDLEMAAAPVLVRYLTLLPDEPGTHLVLDLARVSFIDRAGYRAILRAGEQARQRGHRMTFGAMSPAVRHLRGRCGPGGRSAVRRPPRTPG